MEAEPNSAEQTQAPEVDLPAAEADKPTSEFTKFESSVEEPKQEFISAGDPESLKLKKKFIPVDWPILSRAKKPEVGKRCYRVYKDTKEFVDVAAQNVLDAIHSSSVAKPFKIMTPFCGKEVMIKQTELLAS